ncbi:MAG TPA: hypothetical protein PKE06_00890 [Flavilitoribacter sp.]|nr:hypothetical protein [Flavilitoribacter sp.]HMQ90184.1 hypothetical protein [Flavilitoribacter sp.]
MYNSFISVVHVLHYPHEVAQLPAYLTSVYSVLAENFSDFEVILVNNHTGENPDPGIAALPADLKQHVYLLNLSSKVDRNHAILAGLDRANGDYTVIFEPEFARQPGIIVDLFEKTREHFDIVYLRARNRKTRLSVRWLYTLFYAILKRYSSLRIDDKAHDTRIISRRALNSLLKLRENLRYMKAIYSIVGYNTTFIETDEPLIRNGEESFSEKFRTSLVAITSFTTFLNTLLLWIFLVSLCFLIYVAVDALKVKFTGFDVFGNAQTALSGWTYLVMLISIFFAVTCLNLYLMSIYLSNIYHEIKKRPLYIIESIKRF